MTLLTSRLLAVAVLLVGATLASPAANASGTDPAVHRVGATLETPADKVLLAARSGARHTVLDYYLMLPDQYFEIPKASRKDLLDTKSGGVLDIPNGFIHAVGDGAQPTLDVALFHAKDGTDIIAVYSDVSEENDAFMDFYAFRGGRFVKQPNLLPRKFDPHYTYRFPRIGTSIEYKLRNEAYFKKSYRWNGARFE